MGCTHLDAQRAQSFLHDGRGACELCGEEERAGTRNKNCVTGAGQVGRATTAVRLCAERLQFTKVKSKVFRERKVPHIEIASERLADPCERCRWILRPVVSRPLVVFSG